MKITKYNQACLLVETNDKRILIDPGCIGLTDDMVNKKWINIDIILVTHRHQDHCDEKTINTIVSRDNAIVYTTEEIINSFKLNNVKIIKEGDLFNIDNIKIEVTKAIHGYLTGMRENNKEILENVGYIIDDGKTKLYITSDTINFYNNYKCDVLCMPFNGNGLTLGIIDGTKFAKNINPKLLLPIHMQHPSPEMNPDIEVLKKSLEQEGINYKILNIDESIDIY